MFHVIDDFEGERLFEFFRRKIEFSPSFVEQVADVRRFVECSVNFCFEQNTQKLFRLRKTLEVRSRQTLSETAVDRLKIVNRKYRLQFAIVFLRSLYYNREVAMLSTGIQ